MTLLFGISAISLLGGCASSPPVNIPSANATIIPTTIPSIQMPQTTTHLVVKGETLWRIAKNYGVDLDDLTRVNHINDSTKLETNQLLTIPEQKHSYPITSSDDFIWPIEGNIRSSFSQLENGMLNKGIDIHPTHSSQVVAARSGKIVFTSDHFKQFGKTLIIEHPDGLLTVYAHTQALLAKKNTLIRQGEPIAQADTSADGYIHFEIRKGYTPKNPLFYLP